MKKSITCVALAAILFSCNVSVNKEDGNPNDTTKLDTILEKIDTTIDKGVDTLKKKFNNITHHDKDTAKTK